MYNFPKKTDAWVMLALQMILLILFSIAVAKGIYAYFHPGVELTVQRGESSLNWLYTSYLATTVAFGLAIQACDCMSGNKVALIAFDYFVLTYLFFASSWFVNSVAYSMFQSVTHL